MESYTYSIVMTTPMGARHGRMLAAIDGRRVSGSLSLMGRREPFEGQIDESGRCSISGTLVTLMRKIHYTACGTITPCEVSLKLSGERNIFGITGCAETAEGGE